MTTVSPMVKEMCLAPTAMETISSLSSQMRSMSDKAVPGTTKLQSFPSLSSSVSQRLARR